MGDLAQGKHLPTQQQLVQSTPGPPFYKRHYSITCIVQAKSNDRARASALSQSGFHGEAGLKVWLEILVFTIPLFVCPFSIVHSTVG